MELLEELFYSQKDQRAKSIAPRITSIPSPAPINVGQLVPDCGKATSVGVAVEVPLAVAVAVGVSVGLSVGAAVCVGIGLGVTVGVAVGVVVGHTQSVRSGQSGFLQNLGAPLNVLSGLQVYSAWHDIGGSTVASHVSLQPTGVGVAVGVVMVNVKVQALEAEFWEDS